MARSAQDLFEHLLWTSTILEATRNVWPHA
jgi:hypothetical protein